MAKFALCQRTTARMQWGTNDMVNETVARFGNKNRTRESTRTSRELTSSKMCAELFSTLARAFNCRNDQFVDSQFFNAVDFLTVVVALYRATEVLPAEFRLTAFVVDAVSGGCTGGADAVEVTMMTTDLGDGWPPCPAAPQVCGSAKLVAAAAAAAAGAAEVGKTAWCSAERSWRNLQS